MVGYVSFTRETPDNIKTLDRTANSVGLIGNGICTAGQLGRWV